MVEAASISFVVGICHHGLAYSGCTHSMQEAFLWWQSPPIQLGIFSAGLPSKSYSPFLVAHVRIDTQILEQPCPKSAEFRSRVCNRRQFGREIWECPASCWSRSPWQHSEPLLVLQSTQQQHAPKLGSNDW